MTTRSKPLAGRVDTLEERMDALEKTTERLRRDQAKTRRLVRELGDRVDTILPGVDEKLAAQTGEITSHVDGELAKHRDFVLDAIVTVARQAPAWTIVLLTLLGAVVAGLAVDALLIALQLPHLG